MADIAIVGAGITGLTTAYLLQKEGHTVHLFEKKLEIGGAIRSEYSNGWLTEYGPNTLLLKDAEIYQFLEEAGLTDQLLDANPSASKRFIVKGGELLALPGSLKEAYSTPLFTTKGKLRILLEPFIRRRRNGGEETVAQFVERRLGRELLDYGINPFIAGIYANRPENLSLEHAFPAMYETEQRYGSLIRGAIAGRLGRGRQNKPPRRLVSFKGGLQTLPDRIAEPLEHLHLNRKVKKLTRTSDNRWMIQHGKRVDGPFDHVVLNIPVYQWEDALFPGSQPVGPLTQQVPYPPLSVLHLGYRKEDVDHPLDGFGFLVPEAEERMILGALFSSTLFEGRAPKGHHLLTLFIGGGRQPGLAPRPSESLLDLAEKELTELIGLSGSPVFKEHVFWPKAIPGYPVGHGEIAAYYARLERENRRVHLAGNFRNGISVPDCIRNGIRIAEKISNAR